MMKSNNEEKKKQNKIPHLNKNNILENMSKKTYKDYLGAQMIDEEMNSEHSLSSQNEQIKPRSQMMRNDQAASK